MDATLAQEFAVRLAEILPPRFSARAMEDQVCIGAPDGLGMIVGAGAADEDPNDLSNYVQAAWIVLSAAQDVVSETTAMPWPRARGDRLDLALPGSRVEDSVLYTWFGDEHDPVLRLRPIVLTRNIG
jgi:hypothetical protein